MTTTQPTAPALLTVDLGALAANYRYFCDLAAPGAAVAGVIKADGYGLGMPKVLAALENQDCPFYFVATPDEALAVRALTKKPVAVLGGLYHGAEDSYVHHRLVPVLNSLEEIGRWQEQAQEREIPLPAIIHIDTGMNRLGLGPDEVAALHAAPDRMAGLDVLYFMSHFACADEAGHDMTAAQHDSFIQATAPFPQIKKSLANSSGACRSPDYHFDLLRPGMALYGLNPAPEQDNPMQPVVTLQTRILQVRTAAKGSTAGYGATYRFEKEAQLATVALGYADGILRSLSSSGAALYYNGTACPLVGRVSMDLVIADITALDPVPPPGAFMDVIGPQQDADILAAAAGTIGYEILTGLSPRYQRRYI